MSITNNFRLLGRLVSDPVYFNNKNGSQTVKFTVAAQRTVKDANGAYGTDFIPVQGYIADPAQRGVYSYLSKGRQIIVEGHMSSFAIPSKTEPGKTEYGVNHNIDGIQLVDSKTVAAARQAAATTAPAVTAQAQAAAPAPTPAPVVIADEFEGVL